MRTFSHVIWFLSGQMDRHQGLSVQQNNLLLLKMKFTRTTSEDRNMSLIKTHTNCINAMIKTMFKKKNRKKTMRKYFIIYNSVEWVRFFFPFFTILDFILLSCSSLTLKRPYLNLNGLTFLFIIDSFLSDSACLWLCWGFSAAVEIGGCSPVGAWASHRGGFSCCTAGVLEHKLSSCGMHWLSCSAVRGTSLD